MLMIIISYLFPETKPRCEFMVGIVRVADSHVSFEEFNRTRNLSKLDSELLYRYSNLYFVCPDKKMVCCYNNSSVRYILSELREIINKANSKRQSLIEVVYRDNRHMSFARKIDCFASLYLGPCLRAHHHCMNLNNNQSVLCCFSKLLLFIMSYGAIIAIPLYFVLLAYFIVWVLMSVLDILTFYHYRYSKKNECAYISSQMMTVPELDGDNVDNFVYDELEVLRLRLEEKYDKKVELWTGVENVEEDSWDQFMLLFSFNPNV